jgi:hypothetical protein
MAMILDTNALSALFEGDMELATLLENDDRHHLPVIATRDKYRLRIGTRRFR